MARHAHIATLFRRRLWVTAPRTPGSPGSRLSGRGFTLAEIVVSVGILAVIAAALAAVFSAVGDTVSSGRRVNRLNSFAAQFMQVMRVDIEERMRTPDNAGPGSLLVIRHEFADDRTTVDLYPGDPNPRERRIDQLLFYVGGEFRSQRPPLVRGLDASSTVALAYYGHGTQQEPPELGADGTEPFFLPRVWDLNKSNDSRTDNNDTSLGNEGVAYSLGLDSNIANPQLNPNRYASDWALMRHITLLVEPRGLTPVSGSLASELPFNLGNDTEILLDKPVQYAGQPAAWSPFGTLSRSQVIDPFWRPINGMAPFSTEGLTTNVTATTTPVIESGLVDIAYATPTTIDTLIRSAHLRPFSPALLNASRANTSDVFYRNSVNQLASISVTPQVGGVSVRGFEPGLRNFSREIMHGWMLDLMPGDHFGVDADQRSRMRIEREPTRTLFPDTQLATLGPQRGMLFNSNNGLIRAVLGADQQMVSGGTWVPQCTEFIVEWSYGQIDRFPGSPSEGQVIWYGLPRWDDRDNDGNKDNNEPWVANRYLNDLGQSADEYLPVYTTRLPLTNLIMPGANPATEATDRSPALLLDRGWRNVTNAGREVFFDQQFTNDEDLRYATSLFYNGVDPMYWQGDTLDPDSNGQDDFRISDPGSQWRWPTMLRITATFADPEDVTIETTIQSVFRIPGNRVQ